MGKGIVEVDIARGRRELGWEVGYSAQNGLTTASFTAAIVLNNDADFVAKRLWVAQFGTDAPLDPRISVQIRDGATAQVMQRVAGSPYALGCGIPVGPAASATGLPWGKFAMTPMGLPAPYVIRRGSSVFLDFANASGLTIAGDIYVALEGYRVFPGEPEDVPAKIKGYALPFNWNGTLTVTANATNAVAKLGTISMPGLGVGHYVLKAAYCNTTKLPTAVSTNTDPSPFLGLQIYSTKNQSKRLIHATSPSTVGDFMPMSFFTGGGISAPWMQPIYLAGTDAIFADLYGNPTWFSTNTPGVIELGLTGVFIPA